MKILLFLALFAAVLVNAGDVVTLTNDNFDQMIEDNPIIMVKFYATWFP
jgi:hypothetical protein